MWTQRGVAPAAERHAPGAGDDFLSVYGGPAARSSAYVGVTLAPEDSVWTHGVWEPTGGRRSGFSRRFKASMLDFVIVGTVAAVVDAVAKGAGPGLGVLISLAYYTYFEGRPEGQTLGKHVIGVRVVDSATGASIGYGRAAVRWLGRIVSSVPLLLGYLWMLWDPERQTWHDKLAGDVVIEG